MSRARWETIAAGLPHHLHIALVMGFYLREQIQQIAQFGGPTSQALASQWTSA